MSSRRLPVPVVLAGSYVTGLLLVGVVLAASGEGVPGGDTIVYGVVAGLAGIVGLGFFYRGLAIGTMSIVAPISATGVAIPVVAGLVGGDDPSAVTSVGLVLAVVGVVLASRESPAEGAAAVEEAERHRSILYALLAGACFGVYFTLADRAAAESVVWTMFLGRVTGAPILVAIVVVTAARASVPRTARGVMALVVIGLFDAAATALYAVATTKGELSGVAVAAALYPVVTVLLAAALLHERVRGSQAVGVVAALGGVVMIAAG